MRSAFVKDGRLNNQIDRSFRNINDRWPGVAFARQITAGRQRSANVYFGIAHVRRPAISYTVGQFNQLWESYFNGDDNQMINFVFGEREDALKRAEGLDNKILGDARKVGGESYAKVVSAALRQVGIAYKLKLGLFNLTFSLKVLDYFILRLTSYSCSNCHRAKLLMITKKFEGV